MASTYNLSHSKNSDYTNQVAEITVSQKSTEGLSDQKETEVNWGDFPKWNGYFYSISDLQSALIMKAVWNTGAGYEAISSRGEATLKNISGTGKEAFEDILFNMDLTSMIGGDSFAQIVRNNENRIINIKPLDPQHIKAIYDERGLIKRYEQTAKNGSTKAVKVFRPEDIFHIQNNRYADNLKGISAIQALEETIKADNESFTIMQKMARFQARPFILWKLKTDDETLINDFISKIEKAKSYGEDTFIPDDDNVVSFETVEINPSNFLFEWRTDTRNKFYRSVGLPQIVPGAGGQSTESESKVIYTAFIQIVRQRQKYLERMVWEQLAIKINLNPPKDFFDQLATDASKDGNSPIQQNDVTVGSGR